MQRQWQKENLPLTRLKGRKKSFAFMLLVFCKKFVVQMRTKCILNERERDENERVILKVSFGLPIPSLSVFPEAVSRCRKKKGEITIQKKEREEKSHKFNTVLISSVLCRRSRWFKLESEGFNALSIRC